MYELYTPADLDPLLEDIAGKKVVMLGEASHGTHEYYTWRTAITKILIQEKGFRFIAVEGDWPDCYRINRYVKGYKDAGDSITGIMNSFDRWPSWMWANWEIAALAEWLREYNKTLPAEQKAGFYGLDVYSLWDSMNVMMNYLEKEDRQAADAVKKAIHCFEPFNEDEHFYAQQTLRNHNCKEEVIGLLKEIRVRAAFLDGDREAGFNAEQNAWIAVNAERYYRSMIGFDNESWNIRDWHMMDTLVRLMQFHGKDPKAIVWEHNTHIGDARATDMVNAGMVNVGQLAREKYGEENVYLAGFASYSGTVMAGNAWGSPAAIMDMPPAVKGSIESILHKEFGRDGYLLMREEQGHRLHAAIPHRAIGVVYNPAWDKRNNYVSSVLADRYDALIYLDKTKALHPVHPEPGGQKIPETYPFGI